YSPSSTSVAVDAAGNVFITSQSGASSFLSEWNATTQQDSILFADYGNFYGVTVDAAGNVYFADSATLREWNATTQQVSIRFGASGNFYGAAVDAAGNVYIADYNNNAIRRLDAATQQVSTLVSTGLNRPVGVAVDA